MRTLIHNAAVATAYFLLAFATARFLAAYGIFPAPFWPSAGVALAAALLGGRRVWAGIYVGSFLSNWLLFHAPLLLAAAISATNVLAPAVGAALILRATGTPQPFFRVRDAGNFMLYGVLLHGLIASTGGVTVSLLAGAIPPAEAYGAWGRWILSDGGGTFLLGPALILWLKDHHIALRPAERWKGFLLVSATLLFTAALFFGLRTPTHPYLGLPYLLAVPLMWFTVYYSVRAGAALLAAIALIAIAGTLAHHGPFNLLGAERPLLGVGFMVVAFGISTFAVGGLVSERRSAEVRLWELNETLEERVAARTLELHRRATEDGLTGVANRSYFFELGDQALEHARRTGRPITALVLDLDELKTINDTHGHHAGDAAIAQLAAACRASLRDSDLVGRTGGDEFAILLPNVDVTGAAAVAARIRDKLRSAAPAATVITVSIGAAGFLTSDAGLGDLLRRADAAMYDEKRRAQSI